MQVIDVVKELTKMGLSDIKLNYDKGRDLFYWDLNTGCKSHLHLFEDWHVEGRYNHSNKFSVVELANLEDILCWLFYEFKGCRYGRDFYNQEWMEIGVQLGCVKKKVQAHTTINYE